MKLPFRVRDPSAQGFCIAPGPDVAKVGRRYRGGSRSAISWGMRPLLDSTGLAKAKVSLPLKASRDSARRF